MPFHICQYVINVVVNLPIRTDAGLFMNISVWKHRVPNS